MDKYKVIAEKITYSLDGYIADHNNRNFGDADGWLRHVRNGWEEFIEAHPDSLNLHEYLQHQQAKVEEQAQEIANLKSLIQGHELRHQQNLSIKQKLTRRSEELQKRVDKALELMQKPVIVGEPAKYVCARFKEIEQALKGEG
ncbi:hypothetical protein P4Y54_000089 [Acinetobacter baumannii]|nr:hypothetical protein [Acinetobacter baumannii]